MKISEKYPDVIPAGYQLKLQASKQLNHTLLDKYHSTFTDKLSCVFVLNLKLENIS